MEGLDFPKSLLRESLTFDLLETGNYPTWRKNMRILLMRMSLLDLIDHDKPPDGDIRWDKADKWAFSEIYFRCKLGTQTSLTDDMTARQAWTRLEVVFHSASTANIFQLTTRISDHYDMNTIIVFYHLLPTSSTKVARP